MKKLLGSILAITSLAGFTSFASAEDNILRTVDVKAVDYGLLDELDSLAFTNKDVSLTGYLSGSDKLVLIVEYSNKENIQLLEEHTNEKYSMVVTEMENIVFKTLCSQKKISSLINNESYKVEVEYLLDSGTRYMVRNFTECK